MRLPAPVRGNRRSGSDFRARPPAYRDGMGVLGEMFPGPKIQDEAGEDADGQKWRLGPIDLESGVVQVHRAASAPESPDDED